MEMRLPRPGALYALAGHVHPIVFQSSEADASHSSERFQLLLQRDYPCPQFSPSSLAQRPLWRGKRGPQSASQAWLRQLDLFDIHVTQRRLHSSTGLRPLYLMCTMQYMRPLANSSSIGFVSQPKPLPLFVMVFLAVIKEYFWIYHDNRRAECG